MRKTSQRGTLREAVHRRQFSADRHGVLQPHDTRGVAVPVRWWLGRLALHHPAQISCDIDCS